MPIKQLFIVLTLCIAVLLGLLGVWQLKDSRDKIKAVQWLQESSRLLNFSQGASIAMAAERGLGSYLIEGKRQNSAELFMQFKANSAIVDKELQRMHKQLKKLNELSSTHPIEQYLQSIDNLEKRLAHYRGQLLRQVQEQQPGLKSHQWVEDYNQAIEQLYGVAGISMLPLPGNIYSYSAQPVIKDVLFTMADYIGRDRALLVVVLSRNEPLTSRELATLSQQKSVYTQLKSKSHAILTQFEALVGLHNERQQLEQQVAAYEKMRNQILHEGRYAAAYTLDADEWFQQATMTINSVHQISTIIGSHLEKNVERLQANTYFAVAVLVLALLSIALLFCFSIMLLHRRILQPVSRLVVAAECMGAGDFGQPIEAINNDEVGVLAAAFDNMRLRLQEDKDLQEEYRRVAEKLNFVSHYNQTTNLPNRVYLQQQFKRLRNSAKNNSSYALLSLTVGRLKHINDSFGWSVGDHVLREFGHRLKKCSHRGEVVCHQEGGKFAVLVPNLDQAMIQDYAQALLEQLKLPISIVDLTIQTAPRIGVTVAMMAANQDFANTLKQADMALHHAEEYSLSICIYDEQLDVAAQQRLALESSLRQALKLNQLELHYQPKVDIASGKIVAFEALARWQNRATGKFVSPEIFIPIAEETGLIRELGYWVLLEACLQAKHWFDSGFQCVIAVNVSAQQIVGDDFLEQVAQVLKVTGLPPELLELELTENTLIENSDRIRILLARFKKMHVQLAIDDFGTGYSNLSYLSWLPVDTLKIDRSFIDSITSDFKSASLVTAVIALAKRMGLRVIAEGVETQGQLLYLAEHGCHEIQGYYFSRPLTSSAATDKLRHHSPASLVKQAI